MKGICRGNEIPIADHLMSFRDGLSKDFMKGFNTLKEAQQAQCENVLSPKRQTTPIEESLKFLVSRNIETNKFEPNIEGWRGVCFRFLRNDGMIEPIPDFQDYERYPTASKMLDEFSDICGMMTYSCIAPNTILHRHTDPENRDGKYLRIHIPLIIPDGELFLEVYGEEVRWDNVFGFNNQLSHSAHNYTNYHRLIFLFDLDMEAIGMTKFSPWSDDLKKNVKPFVRGWYE